MIIVKWIVKLCFFIACTIQLLAISEYQKNKINEAFTIDETFQSAHRGSYAKFETVEKVLL